jgi:methyl coenzyme M reductase beta subunit
MKNQAYHRLLAAAVFLSQTILGASSEVILQTPEDVNAYLLQTVENIQNTVEKIVVISEEERTFENTLKEWNRLTDQLAVTFNALADNQYSQAIQNFHSVINSEIFQNSELYNALMSYAHKASYEEGLNPYQRNAIQQFLKNSEKQHKSPTLHYLKGAAQRKVQIMRISQC